MPAAERAVSADPLHELKLAADFARACEILRSLPPQDIRRLRDILCRWILACASETPAGPSSPVFDIAALFDGIERAVSRHYAGPEPI
jgi:hypothetical protein